MDPRHLITLSGKQYVTYEGLLDEAHRRGLVRIATELLQTPGEHNGWTAVCRAEIELAGEPPRHFSGLGDASPQSVSRAIAPHLIRMAETRAKARALRDAVNVGITALEELGDDTAPEVPLRVIASRQPEKARAQLAEIDAEMARAGMDAEAGRAYLKERFGKTSRLELTRGEARLFLGHLRGLPGAPARKAARP